MNKLFSDISGFERWESVEPLNKGWSTDKKYIVKTKEGEKLLLRIADGSELEQKKKEYEIIGKYAKLGFDMSKPMDFGVCDDGAHTYMLLTWVEGEDLESALPKLSKEEQYELGRCAGTILRRIHDIPVIPTITCQCYLLHTALLFHRFVSVPPSLRNVKAATVSFPS